MKFRIKKVIKNVFHEYLVSENTITYLSKNGGVVIYNLSTDNSYHYFENYNFYGFILTKSMIILDNANSKISILHLDNGENEELNGYALVLKQVLSNGTIILTNEYNYNTVNLDLENEVEVWSCPIEIGFSKLLYEEHIFFNTYQNKKKLFSINIINGKIVWELDLGLESKTILQIYAVSGDILLVSYATVPHHFGLCGIDVHTGKVVWDIQPKGFYPYTTQAKSESLISIQTSSLIVNGIQIAVGVNIFLEIENISGKIMRYGTLSVLDNLSLHIKNFVLRDNYIYFTAHYQRSFGAIVVGVLDYETLSILWWEKITLPTDNDCMGHFLVQLQVSENRIYALDDMGTLHIYERDETIHFEKPLINGLLAFEDLPAQNIDNQNFNKTDDLPF